MSRLIDKQPNYERKRITMCVWRQIHCGLSLINKHGGHEIVVTVGELEISSLYIPGQKKEPGDNSLSILDFPG